MKDDIRKTDPIAQGWVNNSALHMRAAPTVWRSVEQLKDHVLGECHTFDLDDSFAANELEKGFESGRRRGSGAFGTTITR